MAKTKRREPSTTNDRVGSESDHSHFEYPSVPGNWEAASATDFAITTVNVPDRLDAQELRARRDAEDAAPRVSRFHPSDLTRWAGRAFLIAILGAVVWGGFQLAVPVREAFSANGLSERLTVTLKAPTTVRASRMEWWPVPRLVVSGIDVVGRFAIPEASVHFNWSDAVEALRSAKLVLGEVMLGFRQHCEIDIPDPKEPA